MKVALNLAIRTALVLAFFAILMMAIEHFEPAAPRPHCDALTK